MEQSTSNNENAVSVYNVTFKTSNKLPAHTLYNKLCVFQLQIFAFKKTFAEEMLQAIQACTFAFCDGCTKLTEHSCHSPLWAIHQYWEHGRFFFDMNNFMNKNRYPIKREGRHNKGHNIKRGKRFGDNH